MFNRSDDHGTPAPAEGSAVDPERPQPDALAIGAAGSASVGRLIERGQASYYGTSTRAEKRAQHIGDGFVGQPMADGAPFDPHAMTVAHKTLPLGTPIVVRAAANGKEVAVTVTDRGPYEKGRIVDGTPAVADKLGYKEAGHAEVELYEDGPSRRR